MPTLRTIVSFVSGSLCAAIVLAGVSGPAGAAGDFAPSAQEITPLLIGAKVPELTLRAGDGSDFDLAAAIAKKPTILVFYRGGW
jgi:hypothetical protein